MAGECQTKNRNEYDKDDDEKPIVALDEGRKEQRINFYCERLLNPIVSSFMFI